MSQKGFGTCPPTNTKNPLFRWLNYKEANRRKLCSVKKHNLKCFCYFLSNSLLHAERKLLLILPMTDLFTLESFMEALGKHALIQGG